MADKKPRLQLVASAETAARISNYAEKNGWSMSRAIDELVRARLDQLDAMQGGTGAISDATPEAIVTKVGSDDEAMAKMRKVIELAKMAGVL